MQKMAMLLKAFVTAAFTTTGGLLLVLVLGPTGLAPAHEGHEHGGVVAKTRRHQFEVVFRKDGLNVSLIGPDQARVDASKLSGTATFTLPGAPRPFAYPLQAAPAGPGQALSSLGLTVDLSKVPTTGAKVTFQIVGLPDPAERAATFTVPFTLGEAAGVTFAKATPADQQPIATQKVCKVSGEPLGSMGVPIKATRGERSVFLCCASCEKAVLADPDKYLGAEITTSKATPADQQAIARQKTCPNSGEPLGSMGVPIKVTRGGRSIFLCCASCLKPVLAAPDKFLGAPGAAAASR